MGGRRKYPADYYNLVQTRSFKWLGPPVRKTNTKTTWQCPCGYVWESTYNNISQGKGCPSCGGSLPKTKEDYYNLATKKNIKWIGGILPPNVKTKTEWQCKKGHQWEATYDSVHGSSQGCRDCGLKIQVEKKRLKSDHYHELAKEKGIEWLGPLPANNKEKTWWKCPKGHQWEANKGAVRQTRLCPICNNRYPKTEKDYHSLAKTKGFSWVSTDIPKSVLHKTTWECSKGHLWDATYDSVTRNGCPCCYISKGEAEISRVLKKLRIYHQRQYSHKQCKAENGRLLYFDFFGILESGQSFFIEYDGEQHFKPIEFYGGRDKFLRRVELDKIKTQFARLNKTPLLRIAYIDFDSIETIILEWFKNIESPEACEGTLSIQLVLPFDN